MATQMYQLHTGIPGSAYQAGRFFRVIGEPVPEFLQTHGAPFNGPLPVPVDDPSIVVYDALRAAKEAADVITFPEPHFYVREDVKRQLHVDDVGLNVLMDHYGFPRWEWSHKAKWFGANGPEVSRERWDGRAVDAWIAGLRPLVQGLRAAGGKR